MLRWNHDKHYLGEFHECGVASVPTVFVERHSIGALKDAVAILGTRDLVIKPAIGGAAYQARPFALGRELGDADAQLAEVLACGGAMIQPFVSSVLDERERSVVFLGGEFSHAY